VDHLYFPAIVYSFVYEVVKGIPFFRIFFHEKIGPLQGIEAKRAEGDQLGLSLFLHADEVADGCYLVHQIVLGQRVDCTTAVPSGDLVESEAESLHGSHGRLLQIPGSGLQGAAGIISQAHFLPAYPVNFLKPLTIAI